MALSLELFRELPVQGIAAGECVLEQGASTGRLFVLIEGKVEISKDGKLVTACDQPGDIFGDVSALLKIPHTTSVVTVDDSKFHVVADGFGFLQRNPAVCVQLCELQARRLVSVTNYLVDLKKQCAGDNQIESIDAIVDKLINRQASAPAGSPLVSGEFPY